MERTITTTVGNILSLISCAEDYGFKIDVLFDEFRDMLNNELKDEEIESYCQWFLSEEAIKQGYSEEDYEKCKETLIEFKEKYIGS